MANAAEHLADLAGDAGDHAEESLRRRASELQKFFDDVEELLRKVSNVNDAATWVGDRRASRRWGRAMV